jgi:hypothetical protein
VSSTAAWAHRRSADGGGGVPGSGGAERAKEREE